MGINPIQKLKNKQSSHPYQLLSQGESPDKGLQAQNLDIEEIKDLTQENKYFEGMIFGIKLDQKLPQKVATLEVESPAPDKDYIIIRCRHGLLKIGEQLNTAPIEVPEISLDKMMSNVETQSDLEKKSREFIGSMRKVSKKKGKAYPLTSWLRHLQKKLQDKFEHQLSYLIINDRTTFEIPWEMLELKPNSNDYLGSSIVTVRWTEIPDQDDQDDENSSINLKIEESNCYGKIVAYLNTRELPDVQREKATIEKFNLILHENIDDFLIFLDSTEQDISLIFIASHGSYGNDFETFLGEADNKQQISLRGLDAYDFKCLAQSSSIVFMNACHSGRLHQDSALKMTELNPKTGQYYLTGFPSFFLEKGATGVIGTLWEVLDKYAAKVSDNFFVEYQQNPQLSVATLLKNLRKQAVTEYIQNKNKENTLLFFYTFMYIYYGNPMTKLELISKEDS